MSSGNPFAARSLALHKKLKGKFGIESKMKIKNASDLALVYTPGVGAVSSYLATHKDKVAEYTIKNNTVAVVSDGSAVLGLGNIGPEGALPVMEGKAVLFKQFANIDAFPIVLATQDVDEIVRTVINIAPVFGGINLEDISAPRCFEVERRLQEALTIPVMHDDQHGTAIVALAGLINACAVVKKSLKHITVMILGAGAAGTALAELLMLADVHDIIVLDRKGILSSDRKDLEGHKKMLAEKTNHEHVRGGIQEALPHADVVVGLSGPDLLTKEDIRRMKPKPIVFALANPVPEILPPVALAGGAAVVATGRSDYPNQLNNALGFPGIFRGALDHHVRKITRKMELDAARALAAVVKKPTAACIIPSVFDPRVAKTVAKAIHD